MTDPKEKKPAIQTRTPGRLAPRGGMFDRIHLPSPGATDPQRHPIEEILASATASAETTPVATPVGTPVATPVAAPVATPVVTPAAEPRRERDQYLDATHTASEKSIYSVMYRETVSKGVRDRHFGFKELSGKSGIRSDATVRRALDGLIAKLSVEVVAYRHGDPLGPRYRVHEPKEILRLRRDAGIEIDPQSKKIAAATGVVTGVSTGVATPVATGAATGGKSDGSTPRRIYSRNSRRSCGSFFNKCFRS